MRSTNATGTRNAVLAYDGQHLRLGIPAGVMFGARRNSMHGAQMRIATAIMPEGGITAPEGRGQRGAKSAATFERHPVP